MLKKEKGQKVNDLRRRLLDEKSNRNKFISGNIQSETNAATYISKFLVKLKDGEELDIKEINPLDLRYLIQAITHLDKSTINLEYVLLVLKQIYDYHFTKSTTTNSFIRKAICHVDLIIYGEKFYS